MKKRDRGAVSVAHVRRKEKAYKHLTGAGIVVGLSSVVLIITANQMSTSIVQNPDSIRLIFLLGVLLAPVSFLIFISAQIAAIAAGAKNWNFVLGFLCSFQSIVSLIFARDILLQDSSSRLSLQTPSWSSYILWSILIASLILTVIVGVYSRKSV